MIAVLYLNRILSGKQSINDVPAKLKDQVATLLIEKGYSNLLTNDELNGAKKNEEETE